MKLRTPVCCCSGVAMIVLLIFAYGGYYFHNGFAAYTKAFASAGVASITTKNPVITSTVPTVNQHEINLKLR
jgi:hypothetical protein